MRLTILGGGGFRVPLVYRALSATRLVDEVTLVDTETGRLQTMGAVLGEIAAREPGAPVVRTTPDLVEGLRGADVIFSAVRVGGTAGRVVDERVALDLGVLGQETVGPGGLAYGLRSVPVVDRVARVIADVAPSAWTISFTNPAGLITEAMRTFLDDRVVGICDTPISLLRGAARALGLPEDDVTGDYLGLNHLGWLRTLDYQGVDHLPALLADDGALSRMEEAAIFGPDWLRALGCLPSEYLHYYDSATAVPSETTRGEFLAAQQATFYDGPRNLAAWEDTLAEREATYMADAREGVEHTPGGYHEVAVRLMAALMGGAATKLILNVANDGAIPALPDDAVVEVTCQVDATGAHRLGDPAPLTLSQLGLVSSVKACERLAIEAARTGDRELAWRAFAEHPLVRSPEVGRRLFEGYLAAGALGDFAR